MQEEKGNAKFAAAVLVVPDTSLEAEVADLFEVMVETMIAAIEAIRDGYPEAYMYGEDYQRGYKQATKDVARRVMAHISGGSHWGSIRPKVPGFVLEHEDANTENYAEREG